MPFVLIVFSIFNIAGSFASDDVGKERVSPWKKYKKPNCKILNANQCKQLRTDLLTIFVDGGISEAQLLEYLKEENFDKLENVKLRSVASGLRDYTYKI